MFTNFELYLIDSLYSFVSEDLDTSDFEYQYIFIKNDLNSYINHTSLENVYYDIICTYDIDDINKAKNMIKNIIQTVIIIFTTLFILSPILFYLI